MKTKVMALMLMAGGAVFGQTRVAIGVQIGRPAPIVVPAPVAVGAYRPPCPGPGYLWIEGYYDGYGNWYDGYWSLPPYAGAYWVAPRLVGRQFYAGYWGGSRGVYRVAPRIARPYYYERGFSRPMPQRYEHGFRGNGPSRGSGYGREYRQRGHR